MRVSIVINNYNYGHFLNDSIGSALQQSYADVEVIIVDDGSSDASKEIIQQAVLVKRHVKTVFKSNGGQGSAINAGFAASTGDVVFFLDADDILMPDAAERVVKAFTATPSASRVQFYLDVIDANGHCLGRRIPSARPPSGDLSITAVERFGGDVGWPPTSGNAFARNALEELLPMPEEPYRLCADQYLLNLSPLVGPIVTLDRSAAFYRQHETNGYFSFGQARMQDRFATRVQADVERALTTRAHQLSLARSLDLPLPETISLYKDWPVHARMRLMSLKLKPETHPLIGDTLWCTGRDAILSYLRSAEQTSGNVFRRLMMTIWIAAVAVAPRRVSRRLISARYFGNPQNRLRKWFRERTVRITST